MRKDVAAWWFGYWIQVRKYKLSCVQSLMESFDVNAAKLASLLTFSPETLRVSAKFADEDNFLEEVEAEFGLKQYVYTEMMDAQVSLSKARAVLASTLREADNLSKAGHSGTSRRTGAEGASNGALSDCSTNTMANAINGKEKALRELNLKLKLTALCKREADCAQEDEDRARQMEE